MLTPDEIREMDAEEREATLADLRTQLLHARGQVAMGGQPADPGEISDLRTSIARILTIEREEEIAEEAEA